MRDSKAQFEHIASKLVADLQLVFIRYRTTRPEGIERGSYCFSARDKRVCRIITFLSPVSNYNLVSYTLLRNVKRQSDQHDDIMTI